MCNIPILYRIYIIILTKYIKYNIIEAKQWFIYKKVWTNCKEKRENYKAHHILNAGVSVCFGSCFAAVCGDDPKGIKQRKRKHV